MLSDLTTRPGSDTGSAIATAASAVLSPCLSRRRSDRFLKAAHTANRYLRWVSDVSRSIRSSGVPCSQQIGAT